MIIDALRPLRLRRVIFLSDSRAWLASLRQVAVVRLMLLFFLGFLQEKL